MHPLLEIENLQIDFANEGVCTSVVHNSSFQLQRNEILAIVGESGSGKSVTALSILQLLPEKLVRYPRGSIRFSPNGLESTDLLTIAAKERKRLRGQRIAMIFQEPMTSLNPVFTCGQQVMEAIRVHQTCTRKEAREKAIRLFQKVRLPDPEIMLHRYPHQISGGQKQRVMIAMAMSSDPDLLICDEPTTALDVTVQQTILELIRELQEETQMGVIFITHDLSVVATLAHRVLVMQQGRIVEAGYTHELFSNPQHPYTKALLSCRPALHPKGKRLPVVSDFLNNLQEIAPQAATGNSTNPTLPPSGELLLQATSLSVLFPKRKNFWGRITEYQEAVSDVSLDIFKGETLGLVGESGCGKTTLGRALLQLIPPSKGRVLFKGKELTQMAAGDLKGLRKEMQLVFQDPYSSLNPKIRIGDAIQEPMRVHGLYGNARSQKDKAVELLTRVDMKAEHLKRYPHEFSGGQRQRIVIARALALQPDFLVCDESVSALDVSVQAQVLNLLNDLKAEMGFTILFISHDLSVVKYLSDRVLVMHRGQIVESGTAEEVYEHPRMDYTRQLLNAIPGRKSTKNAL